MMDIKVELYFCDEESRLNGEITDLMKRAAQKAFDLEIADAAGETEILETSNVSGDVEIGVTVVGGDEIRKLNAEYRGIDSVTDVLSFPQFSCIEELAEEVISGPVPVLAGDVVICCDRAAEQAEEYGTGIVREFVYLTVHSVLHLLGYDHMDEEERAVMRSREEEIMDSIGVSR